MLALGLQQEQDMPCHHAGYALVGRELQKANKQILCCQVVKSASEKCN